MRPKRVLLMYITEESGHHSASVAIENAIREAEPSVETLNINAFNYTSPIAEKIINKTYINVIKRRPEIWEYLYDNPKVLRRIKGLREAIHKYKSPKLKRLFDDFTPDGVICTQAYPCGMVADYKKTNFFEIPLIGVLTDYAPHSYWIYDNVDAYVVPSMGIGKRLIDNGVSPDRVKPFGIPIDLKFRREADRAGLIRAMGLTEGIPIVLVMGGTQGLGPIREMIRILDASLARLQMIVTTGTNKRLYQWLEKKRPVYKKKVAVLPYANNVDELMKVSSVVVTKPGGLTTAEALATGLPMVIVNPIPGQEAMNAKYLLEKGVAVKIDDYRDISIVIESLLGNGGKLARMRINALQIAKPDSSRDIARLMLDMLKNSKISAPSVS